MTSLDAISASDLKRFAICFQNMQAISSNVDWTAAASMYDSKVLVASFKTVTSRALKTANGSPTNINDHKRFAVCFLNAVDKQAIDWAKAAHSYDAKVQTVSFKTVTMRALRKHGFVAAGSTKLPRKRASREISAEPHTSEGSEHVMIRTIEEEYGEPLAAKKPRKVLKTLQHPKGEKADVKAKSEEATKSVSDHNEDHLAADECWL